MRRFVHAALNVSVLIGALTLLGCGTPERNCVPNELLGTTGWIDPGAARTYELADSRITDRLTEISQQDYSKGTDRRPPLNVIAFSGGGSLGAFGAGVLNGWSASGTRPTFDVVTGVSTGSLMATYAFLGPQYDDELKQLFTMLRDEDIYVRKHKLAPLFSDSAASSEPLAETIARQATPELLREVAEAHAHGRRLFVGTTNLDRGRLAIWDMGAIATSGNVELYRKVLLASSSIPGFFPPVSIDVEVNGQQYQELHVDGGISTEIFIRAFMLNLGKVDGPHQAKLPPGSKFWAVSNGKLYADPKCARLTALGLSSQAISGLLYAETRSDLIRIFVLGLVAGAEFNLIALRQDFVLDSASLNFDPVISGQLFEEGYRAASAGPVAWQKRPPELDEKEQELPRTGTVFEVPTHCNGMLYE